ncbi:hypothetical protein [Vulcanococcus sp.]|uniref:hypothetical protein n=1 Tax=Vulcanococcus sp. TaxID=2856995 RepID=UPI003C061C7B
MQTPIFTLGRSVSFRVTPSERARLSLPGQVKLAPRFSKVPPAPISLQDITRALAEVSQ